MTPSQMPVASGGSHPRGRRPKKAEAPRMRPKFLERKKKIVVCDPTGSTLTVGSQSVVLRQRDAEPLATEMDGTDVDAEWSFVQCLGQCGL